jgi:hypothetical protein
MRFVNAPRLYRGRAYLGLATLLLVVLTLSFLQAGDALLVAIIDP